MMKAQLLIKNGTVIDGSRGWNGVMDLAVADGKIAAAAPSLEGWEGVHTVDAKGFLVTAGLIDAHVHLVSSFGCGSVMPNGAFFADGVTSVIDAGSRGILNYEELSRWVVRDFRATVKTMLGLSPTGVGLCFYYPENCDPKYFDLPVIKDCVNRHKDEIVALKLRISRSILGNLGTEPLKAAVKVADEVGLPLVLHTTDPIADVDEICNILRPGDVYSHAFAGAGHTLLDEQGMVKECVWKAREKGIVFDVANGMGHFAWSVAGPAMEQGFFPDTISTDILPHDLYETPAVSLPYLMSKYLNAGMPLADVLGAATWRAARCFGLEKEMGTLAVGAPADISILELSGRRELRFPDRFGDFRTGKQSLIPQMTIKAGRVTYRQVDF